MKYYTAAALGIITGGVGAILGSFIIKPKGIGEYHGKVCGNCQYFGNQECVRKENLFNAMPCEAYTGKNG